MELSQSTASVVPWRIAAILTCHNRREKTIACLRALRDQRGQQAESSAVGRQLNGKDFVIKVFVVDDGSQDGTAEAIRKIWPESTIIAGAGDLFWCGGMRVAWTNAATMDPDHYLLLNDDTTLYPGAVGALLGIAGPPDSRQIAVGAICNPGDGTWAYGGLQSDHSFPMPGSSPRPCRTLNMNAALVPRAVYRELGNLHGAYRHAMGDLDYGLMAHRRGIPILETTSFIGECETNSVEGTWRDRNLGRVARIKKLTHIKGLPLRDWFVYTRRNCGAQWLRFFLSPYVRILLGK